MSGSFESLMQITPRPEFCFSAGQGSWLEDEQGRRYLDFIQGWAVNTLGHCPPQLTNAVSAQLNTLINCSPAFYNRPMVELADLLTANCELDEVFFTNSGAEANEGAIKLARKWGQLKKSGAFEIITFKNAFHGRTLATMSACGKEAFAPLFEPKVSGFSKVPFNNLCAAKAAITDNTVAIMLEPIQGEAGVIPADPQFLSGLRALADEHNLLLIFDEVQTGIGRCGALFCHQLYDVSPDIMTLGKGIGGGLPLAALLSKAHCSVFDYGDQGGTYNGNPVTTSAGIAIMNTLLSSGFIEEVQQIAHYLKSRLAKLAAKYEFGQIRGEGLLLALDTGLINANRIIETAFSNGLILNAPNQSTIRFMPALNLTEQDIDIMIEKLDKAIAVAN